MQAPFGLFWIVSLVVIPLSGLTGLESLLFGQLAAQAKQRKSGSHYQTQSAFNNLATAMAAAIVLLCHLGIKAQVTIIMSALLFFLLSGLKHGHEYWVDKKGRIHLQRTLFSLLLVLACAPLIYPILLNPTNYS